MTFTINGKEKQSPWPEAVADELKAVSFYDEACGDTYRDFLGWCTRAVVDFVRDLEDVPDRIEPGYLATRPRR